MALERTADNPESMEGRAQESLAFDLEQLGTDMKGKDETEQDYKSTTPGVYGCFA